MNKKKSILLPLVIMVLVFIPIFVNVELMNVMAGQSELFDLYYATVPYGILWVETKGGAVFFLFAGAGYIEGNLQETYIVKYYIGNEIHSLDLKSSWTPLVEDGTFQLEKYRNPDYSDTLEQNPTDGEEWLYKIHIPKLPEINQTTNDDWIIVK